MAMRPWGLLMIVSGALTIACGGDDGRGGDAGNTLDGTGTPTSNGDDTGDDGGATTGDGGGATTGDGGGATTGDGGGATTTGMAEDTGASDEGLDGFLDSGTGGPMCETNVQGEWNACLDDMGNVDTTLCNYLGDSDANGFIGCLTSSMTKGANSCFISGCKEVCDCLPPPPTGNAPVVCDAILEGGGFGCALDCSMGETCPDGMECLGSLCFWTPA